VVNLKKEIAMAILRDDVFSGCNGQDAVMSVFNGFLVGIPKGETIEIPPKTMTKLNQIGQALGNIIAGEVSKFNQGVAREVSA
jgi:hypothetical protein